ncbi:MAG TPA: tetratricopeptide repeat protein [Phycisphaerae bacterium]|nr:tetratricopeptide repeat protein [Phycisphaerae bacterium]
MTGVSTNPSPRPFIRRFLAPAIILLAIGASTLAAHWRALSSEALSFDDYQYLVNNPLVTNPGWDSARRFLTEVTKPSTVGGYYQPLAMLSLMIDDALGGGPSNLRVFHPTSLALHVANTILVTVLLWRLFGSIWAAGCAGLLFGVHPLTVEPIPWIGERKTLLATFFALASLIAYVHYVSSGRKTTYLASLGLFVMALLSKPTTTLLPVALLLMDVWPLRRFSWRAILEKVPWFLIAVISAVITCVSQAATYIQTPVAVGTMRIPLVLCHNIVFYICKIIYPVNLSSHYPFPEPLSIANRSIAIGVIGTVVLLSVLAATWRWSRGPAISWLIFFALILPTMGIVGFTIVIASDKYAYLPSIGILMLITSGLAAVKKPAAAAALSTIVLLAAVAEARTTRSYYEVWRTSESLYAHMIALAPRSTTLHFGMGFTLEMHGRPREAEVEYRKAIECDDKAVNARNNLALLLTDQNRLDEAIEQYRMVLKLTPDAVDVHSNLALALSQRGDARAAIAECQAALRIDPTYAKAENNWGVALSRIGKYQEASEHFSAAIRLDPGLTGAAQNLEACKKALSR